MACSSLNQNIDITTLPSGLQCLTFGEKFIQNMDNATPPSWARQCDIKPELATTCYHGNATGANHTPMVASDVVTIMLEMDMRESEEGRVVSRWHETVCRETEESFAFNFGPQLK